jgi:hypothetical protein
MNKTIWILGISLLLATYANNANSETISWTDDAGGMHFTDQLNTVPKKYMKQITVRDDINGLAPADNEQPSRKPRPNREPANSLKNRANQSANVGATNQPPPSGTSEVSAAERAQHRGSPSLPHGFRRAVHKNTRRQQNDIYNSQTDARKQMNDAENSINKSRNVGQQAIDKAHQDQQKAQDLINKSRNTSSKSQQSSQGLINKTRTIK